MIKRRKHNENLPGMGGVFNVVNLHLYHYADTWKVAGNELTWLVRSTTVNSQIDVNANGEITMTHSFSDIFDLRPSMERSDAYNNVTKVLGFLYHDVLGGNDQMRVNATWQKSYKLEVE